MGLDAYVYCNRTRLPFDASTPGVSIDERTGVVDFDDPELYQRFADHVVAVHHRLGNVALVAELSGEARRIGGDHLPIITQLVLGGPHCGDLLEIAELDALEKELNLLAATPVTRSQYMDEFLSHMRELVAAARSQRNPIYFG